MEVVNKLQRHAVPSVLRKIKGCVPNDSDSLRKRNGKATKLKALDSGKGLIDDTIMRSFSIYADTSETLSKKNRSK